MILNIKILFNMTIMTSDKKIGMAGQNAEKKDGQEIYNCRRCYQSWR